ncbi:MAG: hypothetical protein AMJ81_04970 [Phycisphaerae bacterium SM23_33]|nr:MAG: hypothetical protein AMJ81_04970 [Phycisphaerae bacterium SM23_33]
MINWREGGDPWRYASHLAGAVSLVMLLALAVRQVRLATWRRTWQPAAPAWQSLTSRLARRIGMRRPVRVFTCGRLQHPAAAGIIRPALLLPQRCPQPLGPSLRAVLTHELAHLHGRGPMWNLISQTVLAAAWWCPLTWWLHRRGRIESELTADDHVLSTGTAATSLAQTLAGLAESRPAASAPILSGMACHLTRRIKMMLDERIPHTPRSPLRSQLGVLAGTCLLVAAVISVPLVGVVGAEGDESGRPAGAQAGAPPAAAAVPAGPRPDSSRRARKDVSLRIRVKDGGIVIETPDGKEMKAREITFSRSDPDRTVFMVQSDREGVLTITSSARAGEPATAPSPQVLKVFALKHARAQDVLAKLAELYRSAPEPLSMVADERNNTVVVRGARTDLERIEALLVQLDTPAPVLETKVFALQHANAREFVQVLAGLLVSMRRDVSVTADQRTNSIVAAGKPEDLALVAGLAEELDRPADRRAPASGKTPAREAKPVPGATDPQLRVLIGEAERRVIDFQAQLELAKLRLIRVHEARKKNAATEEEMNEAEILLEAAAQKPKSAQKELKELGQLLGEPPPSRAGNTRGRSE